MKVGKGSEIFIKFIPLSSHAKTEPYEEKFQKVLLAKIPFCAIYSATCTVLVATLFADDQQRLEARMSKFEKLSPPFGA